MKMMVTSTSTSAHVPRKGPGQRAVAHAQRDGRLAGALKLVPLHTYLQGPPSGPRWGCAALCGSPEETTKNLLWVLLVMTWLRLALLMPQPVDDRREGVRFADPGSQSPPLWACSDFFHSLVSQGPAGKRAVTGLTPSQRWRWSCPAPAPKGGICAYPSLPDRRGPRAPEGRCRSTGLKRSSSPPCKQMKEAG